MGEACLHDEETHGLDVYGFALTRYDGRGSLWDLGFCSHRRNAKWGRNEGAHWSEP
jgi:hypothetical protein